MSDQSQVQSQAQSVYFNLHVEGVGYLNRVRTVKEVIYGMVEEYLECVERLQQLAGGTA